jgi:integrase/recombinase XerD
VTRLEHAVARFLEAIAVRGHTTSTVRTRESALRAFLRWAAERGLDDPRAVTKAAIERYQRHLFYYREPGGPGVGRGRGRNAGKPLSLQTQHGHLTALKLFFRWLARENWIAYNPASELDLPKLPQRLPRTILAVEEVEAVLAATTAAGELGVRDRALLETLYATGIRRMELANLSLYDVDVEHGSLMVREGKGRRDRMVPIGERACRWIAKYLADVRPQLVTDPRELALFLADDGQPFHGDRLTPLVKRYLEAAGIHRPGACHLFRHTMATLMLENGADIRFIQAMLGHANLETTTIYTRVSLAKLREVYERTHPAKATRTIERAADAERDALLAQLDAEARDDAREGEDCGPAAA